MRFKLSIVTFLVLFFVPVLVMAQADDPEPATEFLFCDKNVLATLTITPIAGTEDANFRLDFDPPGQLPNKGKLWLSNDFGAFKKKDRFALGFFKGCRDGSCERVISGSKMEQVHQKFDMSLGMLLEFRKGKNALNAPVCSGMVIDPTDGDREDPGYSDQIQCNYFSYGDPEDPVYGGSMDILYEPGQNRHMRILATDFQIGRDVVGCIDLPNGSTKEIFRIPIYSPNVTNQAAYGSYLSGEHSSYFNNKIENECRDYSFDCYTSPDSMISTRSRSFSSIGLSNQVKEQTVADIARKRGKKRLRRRKRRKRQRQSRVSSRLVAAAGSSYQAPAELIKFDPMSVENSGLIIVGYDSCNGVWERALGDIYCGPGTGNMNCTEFGTGPEDTIHGSWCYTPFPDQGFEDATLGIDGDMPVGLYDLCLNGSKADGVTLTVERDEHALDFEVNFGFANLTSDPNIYDPEGYFHYVPTLSTVTHIAVTPSGQPCANAILAGNVDNS